MRHPAPASSFGRNCEQSQAPVEDWAQDEKLTWDPLRAQCVQRGYRRKESKEVWKPRFASMGAAEAKRMPVGGDDTDASGIASGKRGRAPAEGMIDLYTPTQSLGRKCRVGDLHLACAADTKVVK